MVKFTKFVANYKVDTDDFWTLQFAFSVHERVQKI